MSDSLDFRIVGEEEAPLNLKDVASEGRLYYNSDTGKFVKKRQIGVCWVGLWIKIFLLLVD